jgi:MoxR-like ATPase
MHELQNWLQKSHRKPLVVRGARQVGKSTLIKLFAEQQGLPLAAVNLERYTNLSPAFATKDPRAILNTLDRCWSMRCVTTHFPCRSAGLTTCTWGQ